MSSSRSSIDWTQLLIGAAVTIMTAAILSIFNKVSDLSQSDARDQIRLEIHDKDIAELKATANGLIADLSTSRVEMARTRATCEDWMRKIRRELDTRQGD